MKKKLAQEPQLQKMMQLICNFFNEFQILFEKRLNEIVPKDEINNMYIKLYSKGEYIAVQIYNSATKTIAYKLYELVEIMDIAEKGLLNGIVNYDTNLLYDASKRKFNTEDVYIQVK